MDRCHPSPCQNGGRCVDHEEDFHCSCTTGFLGRTCEGKLCYSISSSSQLAITTDKSYYCGGLLTLFIILVNVEIYSR